MRNRERSPMPPRRRTAPVGATRDAGRSSRFFRHRGSGLSAPLRACPSASRLRTLRQWLHALELVEHAGEDVGKYRLGAAGAAKAYSSADGIAAFAGHRRLARNLDIG